jgi:hypothetical protein
MIEWHNCSRCGKPCSIVPLSVLFDPEGKRYGGVWYCKTCRIYYRGSFLTYEQILELKNKTMSVEQIDLKEKNNNE